MDKQKNTNDRYEKTRNNMMSNKREICLLINMSRINHDCCGNSDHWWVEEHGVMILLAFQTIKAGTEITFSYFDNLDPSHQFLKEKWGFDCNCTHISALKEISKLD